MILYEIIIVNYYFSFQFSDTLSDTISSDNPLQIF